MASGLGLGLELGLGLGLANLLEHGAHLGQREGGSAQIVVCLSSMPIINVLYGNIYESHRYEINKQ